MLKEPSLKQLQSGDSKAYQFLYESYRDCFHAFAKAYSVPQDAITDIYQEAMIKLYENVMTGRLTNLTSSLKTYIFSIGKFKIYEFKRAQHKMVPTSDFKESPDETFPNTDVVLSERQVLITMNFKKLGKRCQNILTLFYLNGYTIKEIVINEGYENDNTAKAQKSRCLKQLKTLIKT